MKFLLLVFFSFQFFLGFSQSFTLNDFLANDSILDAKVDSIFNSLNDTSRV